MPRMQSPVAALPLPGRRRQRAEPDDLLQHAVKDALHGAAHSALRFLHAALQESASRAAEHAPGSIATGELQGQAPLLSRSLCHSFFLSLCIALLVPCSHSLISYY